MIKTLLGQIKQYKTASILAPVFTAGEVLMEVLIPFVTASIIDKGIDVGVVIGGGNYWRGRSNDNIDRTKADQIGMLATIMNCIYVSEIFRSEGLKTIS